MMSSVMGLKKEDFSDLVDDIVGAATFWSRLSTVRLCLSKGAL